jgi:hypothetical protein
MNSLESNRAIGHSKIKQLKSFPEKLKFPHHRDEETFFFCFKL